MEKDTKAQVAKAQAKTSYLRQRGADFNSIRFGDAKAVTMAIDNSFFDENGKLSTISRDGTKRLIVNPNTLQTLRKQTINKKSLEGDKMIHLLLVNKEAFEGLSQEEQANVIHHEMKGHIIPTIGNEDKPTNMSEDHKNLTGIKGEYSPRLGDEKPGTPQAIFHKEMEESFFNEKKSKK